MNPHENENCKNTWAKNKKEEAQKVKEHAGATFKARESPTMKVIVHTTLCKWTEIQEGPCCNTVHCRWWCGNSHGTGKLTIDPHTQTAQRGFKTQSCGSVRTQPSQTWADGGRGRDRCWHSWLAKEVASEAWAVIREVQRPYGCHRDLIAVWKVYAKWRQELSESTQRNCNSHLAGFTNLVSDKLNFAVLRLRLFALCIYRGQKKVSHAGLQSKKC